MLKVALKHNKSISQPIIGSPTVTLKYTINKQSQISLPLKKTTHYDKKEQVKHGQYISKVNESSSS